MRNKRSIITLVLIFTFLIINNFNIIDDEGNNKGTMEIRNEPNFKNLKQSEFWPNCLRIHIKNDNWSETAFDWIQVNSGTENNPHVIENVTIDSGGLGSAILIENSSDYFIIRNCTLTNSGTGNNAGIFLNYTLNGQLVNNSCSDNNYHGICLHNKCSNNIIVNNSVNNNDRHGIKLEINCTDNTILENVANYNGRCGIAFAQNCNNNSILENVCKYNGQDPMGNYFGIYLTNGCSNNNISKNTVNNNEWHGIHLLVNCKNNTISDNTAKGNHYYGILVRDNSNNNKILRNDVSDNHWYGIGLYTAEGNTISGNIANNLWYYGIFLRINSDNNIITENIANNNLRSGILFDENCDNNTISENTLNYNTQHGVFLSNLCHDNNITANHINYNQQYGIYIRIDSDNNLITANYLYFNTQWAIFIDSVNCNNTLINRNVIVSSDMKFINNAGNNTTLESNYFGLTPPSFTVNIITQSFSTPEFRITINISSQCIGLDVSAFSIQMWWNGIIVSSNNIVELGNGLYNVTLTPIFVTPGEDPILLNMTISAAYHSDKYFETYISVEPCEILKYLQVEITEHSYSLEHFNITFYVYNENGQGVDSATILMWWNGTDVSANIQNLGGGLSFVSLDPITVAPGEDPILLNMIISAEGYEDKSFETYLAVDPDTLYGKGYYPPVTPPEVVLTIILITFGSVGGLIGLIIYLFKRKRAPI